VTVNDNQAVYKAGDQVALKFFLASGFYLILVALVGVLMGIKIMNPDFLYNLRFDLLRPLHLQLMIFGWLSMVLMGAFYYIIPREVNKELFSPLMGNLHFILMHVGILGVGAHLILGYSSGREYLEPILLLDIAVVLVWVIFTANMFITTFKGDIQEGNLLRKPALNFMMLSVLYLGVNYLIGMVPLSGIRDGLAIWTFAHNAVNGWFMLGLMGVMYHIIPRLTGTLGAEPYHKKLTYIHFWSVVIFIPPSVLHHLLYDQAPINLFWKIAGEWTSVGMLLPTAIWVYIVASSFKNSKLVTGVVGQFFMAAMIFYALNCVQGSVQSIRAINSFVHGTQWVTGHAHLALVGWISFGIFGVVYYLVPRITGRNIYSDSLANTTLWLGVIGFVGMFIPLTIAGLIQGAAFSEGLSFFAAQQSIKSYMIMRAVAGVVYTLSAVVFAYNIYKSLSNEQVFVEPTTAARA
jgi:cbb3-type cytochrome c oxidase subunit I